MYRDVLGTKGCVCVSIYIYMVYIGYIRVYKGILGFGNRRGTGLLKMTTLWSLLGC